MKREKVVLLFTGGFESLYNLDKLSKTYDIHLFYVDYGQDNIEKELSAIGYYIEIYKDSVKSFRKVTYPLQFEPIRDKDGNVHNVDIPCRNLLFLSMAGNYATSMGIKKVAYGAVDLGSSWFDGGYLFYEEARYLFAKSYKIKLLAPAMNVPFVKLAKKLSTLDYSHLTFCPDGENEKRNCGVCDKCQKVINLLRREKWSEKFLKKVMS
jgi:7-cyano-7-deazaguanine synthase in queuosine biosynthesis